MSLVPAFFVTVTVPVPRPATVKPLPSTVRAVDVDDAAMLIAGVVVAGVNIIGLRHGKESFPI